MLTLDDYTFISGPFHRLEGWCHDEAAAITLYLQRFQFEQGWAAPSYEIGVFKGKYLSILHHHAHGVGQRTTGIDIFQDEPMARVAAGMERELGHLNDLLLVERNSSTYSVPELIDAVGGLAGWISVDGDHTPEGVFQDLQNAEATLAPWGVIAVDDFLNALAIGVVEGTFRHLTSATTRLRPFCFCANKLLLAFPEHVDLYYAQIPRFCEESAHYPRTGSFIDRRNTRSENWVSQRLLGRSVWLII